MDEWLRRDCVAARERARRAVERSKALAIAVQGLRADIAEQELRRVRRMSTPAENHPDTAE